MTLNFMTGAEAVIKALVENGHFEIKSIDKVIKKYNLDPEKPNPINV